MATYWHPDEEGWSTHVGGHVEGLVEQVAVGVLRASGPFVDTPVRSVMLINDAPDRVALDEIVASVPFATEGLIEDLTVTEWDPMFVALA